MSGITVKVCEEAGDMLTKMLRIYQEKIDKAYLRSEESLTIDLKAKFKPGKASDQIDIETGINFVTDRIKTSFRRVVSEGQDGLFDKKSKKQGPFILRERSIPVHWWPSCNHLKPVEARI